MPLFWYTQARFEALQAKAAARAAAAVATRAQAHADALQDGAEHRFMFSDGDGGGGRLANTAAAAAGGLDKQGMLGPFGAAGGMTGDDTWAEQASAGRVTKLMMECGPASHPEPSTAYGHQLQARQMLHAMGVTSPSVACSIELVALTSCINPSRSEVLSTPVGPLMSVFSVATLPVVTTLLHPDLLCSITTSSPPLHRPARPLPAQDQAVDSLLSSIQDMWHQLAVPLGYRSRFYLGFRSREPFYFELEHR